MPISSITTPEVNGMVASWDLILLVLGRNFLDVFLVIMLAFSGRYREADDLIAPGVFPRLVLPVAT